MHVVLRCGTHLTSISRCSTAGNTTKTYHIRNLLNIYCKTSFRPFSNHMSGTVLDSCPSHTVYQASEDLKGLEWPEEALHLPLMKAVAFIRRVLEKLSTMVGST